MAITRARAFPRAWLRLLMQLLQSLLLLLNGICPAAQLFLLLLMLPLVLLRVRQAQVPGATPKSLSQ